MGSKYKLKYNVHYLTQTQILSFSLGLPIITGWFQEHIRALDNNQDCFSYNAQIKLYLI